MTHELPMQSDSGLSPRFGGFLQCAEDAEITVLPTQCDLRDVAVLVRTDAFDASLTGHISPGVARVLGTRRYSEIGYPVVETIPVDVVNFQFGGIRVSGQHPSETMRKMEPVVHADNPIGRAAISGRQGGRTSWLACVSRIPAFTDSVIHEVSERSLAPSEDAGVGIVIETLAEKLNG